MRQKLAVVGFSYLTGLIFASVFLYNKLIIVITVILFLIAAFYLFCFLKRRTVSTGFICAVIGIIAFYLCSYAAAANAQRLCNGEIHAVKATVCEKTDIGNDLSVYQLYSADYDAGFILYADDKYVNKGDILSFDAEFSILENSALFSTADYYMSKGIMLSAAAKSGITAEYVGQNDIFGFITDYREYLKGVISTSYPDSAGALMKGIFLGDKSSFTSIDKYNIRAAGAADLTAVSGTHFTLIIHILAAILTAIGIGRLPRVKIILILLLSVFLMAFFGFTASVTRAGIMIFVHYCGKLFFRESDCLNSLGLSVLIITLINPLACLDAGLILSAFTTIGAGAAAPAVSKAIKARFSRISKPLLDAVCCSVCASVFSLPLSVLYFGMFSVYSAVTSIITIPFFTLSLVFLLLFALSGGALQILTVPAHLCCEVMNKIFTFIAGLPFSHHSCENDAVKFIIPAGAAVILLTAVYAKKKRQFSVCCVGLTACASLIAAVFLSSAIKGGTVTVIPSSDGENGSVLFFSDKFAGAVITGGDKAAEALYADIMGNNIRSLDFLVIADDNSNTLKACDDIFGEMADVLIASEYDISAALSGNLFAKAEKYSEYEICFGSSVFSMSGDGVIADIDGVLLNISDITDARNDCINICYGYIKTEPELILPSYYINKRQTSLPQNSVMLYYTDTVLYISDGAVTNITNNK